LLTFMLSCSTSDSEAPPATSIPKLVKIVGGITGETWNFNEDGLLSEIKNGSGVVIRSFTYDINNNLISTVGPNGTTTYVYDSNNRLSSVNGSELTYDAANNRYFIDYPPVVQNPDDFINYWEITLTDEGLPINSTNYYGADSATYPYSFSNYIYTNGNMTRHHRSDDTEQNYLYDSNPNPLKEALLPISKVMWGSWNGSDNSGNYLSNNNVVALSYAWEDPESSQMVFTYNSLGLPITRTTQSLYNGDLDGAPYTTYYYYEGDIIPL